MRHIITSILSLQLTACCDGGSALDLPFTAAKCMEPDSGGHSMTNIDLGESSGESGEGDSDDEITGGGDCCEEHGLAPPGHGTICALSDLEAMTCLNCDGEAILCINVGCIEIGEADCCLDDDGVTVGCPADPEH